MNTLGPFYFITIAILIIFLSFALYKQLIFIDKIRIRVKNEKLLIFFILIFAIIASYLILTKVDNVYTKIGLLALLTLGIFSNLLAPYAAGIGDEYIYYSINRSYGTYPIHSIKINDLGTVKLTIKKEKDYVRLEVLRTQIHQIYKLDDLENIKKALEGNIIKIEDRSKRSV